jgi:hypothetical protein
MKKLLPIILSLLALQSAYALNQQQPAACPDASAVAGIGLTTPTLHRGDKGDFWVVSGENNYGTPQTWSYYFLTDMGADTSPEQAVAQANLLIPTYNRTTGPTSYQGDDGWACFYASESDQDFINMGIAATPPEQMPESFTSMRHAFK